MDGCAFLHKLPLLDSGTMGAKGSVQVVIPHVSELYSASNDPPEKEFPMCTVKVSLLPPPAVYSHSHNCYQLKLIKFSWQLTVICGL